jgi:hypothetical protein
VLEHPHPPWTVPDGLLNLVAVGSPTSIGVYGKTEASLAL